MPLTLTGTGNISTGASPSIQLPTSGLVITPQHRYGFLAGRSSNQTLGTNTLLVFDTIVYSIGNLYNNTTGVITAPVTGLYFIMLNVMSPNDGSTLSFRTFINNVDSKLSFYGAMYTGYKNASLNFIYLLNQNDTVDFRSVNVNSGIVLGNTTDYYSTLSAYFLG